MCRQVVLRITDTIRGELPRLLGVVHSLLHRPTVDKLTVLAADILMLAHTHFSLPIEQVRSIDHGIPTGESVVILCECFDI